MPTYTKFTMEVKMGLETIATIEGRPMPPVEVDSTTVQDILNLEKTLEKFFNLRFHIDIHLIGGQ